MKNLATAIVFIFLSVCSASATAGFAEWSVYTPGGNFIRHMDPWKEEHGDCLIDPDGEVLVSHLKRWRYYRGYVAGETMTRYFLFSESLKKMEHFETLDQFESRVSRLGEPLFDWLESQDGFVEANFPMIWGICKAKPAEAKALLGDKINCDRVLSPKLIQLYRQTTWMIECTNLRNEIDKNELTAEDKKGLLHFCEQFRSDYTGNENIAKQ